MLTKLQLLLHMCHIESLKLLIMFSRCIIMSHPDRCLGAAPNWKPGLQFPSHHHFCTTGGIVLSSQPRLKRHSPGSCRGGDKWFLVGCRAGGSSLRAMQVCQQVRDEGNQPMPQTPCPGSMSCRLAWPGEFKGEAELFSLLDAIALPVC